jgi:hypothetical protein
MILKMFKLVKQVKFVTINAQTLRINEIYIHTLPIVNH